MNMSLSKLQEMVKDREAWRAVVHGLTKSWTWLSDWTTTNVQARMTSPHLRMWRYFSHHFPFDCTSFNRPKYMSLKARVNSACLPWVQVMSVLGLLYICLIINVWGKLIRYYKQAQRHTDGKRLWRVCILSVRLNCYTRIVHVLFAAKFKQAVLHIMSSFTLWQLY